MEASAECLATLDPGRGTLKSGGLSITLSIVALKTLYSNRRPVYTQRQRQLVRLKGVYIPILLPETEF